MQTCAAVKARGLQQIFSDVVSGIAESKIYYYYATSMLASIITMFQMPFYGWFLANGWVNKRYGEHFLILACFHIVAAFISYWIQGRK